MRIRLWLSLISLLLLLSPTLQAEPKPKLIFGFSTTADGSPVSIYDDRSLSGFCGALAGFLSKNYDLEPREIMRVDERFGAFAEKYKGQMSVQCGPSSSNFKRRQELNTEFYTGRFSEIFFTTQTKVLIHKDHIDKLYEGQDLQIGILKPTPLNTPKENSKTKNSTKPYKSAPALTTGSVSSLFPHTELVPVESRAEVIKQLREGTLKAYASDALILEDIRRKNLSDMQDEFSIDPPLGSFLREDYVVVIYNPDTNITTLVNNWINGASGLAARQALEQAREGDSFTQTLSDWLLWLNRSDHLEQARSWLMAGVVASILLLLALLASIAWLIKRLRSQAASSASHLDSVLVSKQALLDYSKVLHDDICQTMVAVKRNIEAIELPNPPPLAQTYKSASLKALDDLGQKARQLSHDISEQAIDGLDQMLLEFKQRTSILTQRSGNLRWSELPEPISSHLSFIIREALTNIERHAQAHQVEIEFVKTSTGLNLVIYDDGKGAPKNASSGIGLKNMQNRVEHDLKGQFQASFSKQGSTIRINIPFSFSTKESNP